MNSADSILEKCKQKVKLLMEFSTTCKHIHWSHPAVFDFCVAVEKVLSFGAKKGAKKSGRKDVDQLGSLRILASLSKTDPLCAEIFQQCYPSLSRKQAHKHLHTATSRPNKDYLAHNESPLEYSILWIRACLIEKKLSEAVQVFITNALLYYSRHSILASEVNADIFSFMLIGPCSVRLSQLKPVDVPTGTSPTELVDRMKVLSSRCPKFNPVNSYVWDHMESLYQHSTSMCLFGKNNTVIVMHGKELHGYLSLHKEKSDIILKWIPSTLLDVDDSTTFPQCDSSEIIELCLSINISKEIAYLHCHKNGDRAQLVMVNSDGIAVTIIIFKNHYTIVSFLEHLESGLLPEGCLQPPLFFLRTHRMEQRKNKLDSNSSDRIINAHLASLKRSNLKCESPDPSISVSDSSAKVASASDNVIGQIWNQVFEVRCGSHPVVKISPPTDGKTSSILKGELPGLVVVMPTPDQLSSFSSTMHSGETKKRSNRAETDRRNEIIQDLLERKRKELSGSLLASYFYNWLSYCRHRSNLQKNVAHMLSTNSSYQLDTSSEILTDDILRLLTNADGKITNWGKVLSCVYNGGIEHLLRAKVWPMLLAVYPHDASSSEKELIYKRNKSEYEELLKEGKKMEETVKAAAANEKKKSDSELLSEMISKMTNKPDKQNHSTDDAELENKMNSRCHQYMEELEIIDKDVNRCDRNYEYYKTATNLSKLRNIMACYCLDNLKENGIFYAQGMTDLLAPLLVITDDEVTAYSCFVKLMNRMIVNFPPNEGMHKRLTNMRNLTETLEPDFFHVVQQSDFLFCRRWFLLAFKREFSYNDIFRLWETMWAAEHLVSDDCFMEFFALSLLRKYIATIIHRKMDTVEMLILFGEMESRQHNGEFEMILKQTLLLISQIKQNLTTE